MEFDKEVLEVFLENQSQLFSEEVADSLETAEEFLEDCMATVFPDKKALLKYIDEEGIDVEGDITEELEVFALPDGRYLYVEA